MPLEFSSVILSLGVCLLVGLPGASSVASNRTIDDAVVTDGNARISYSPAGAFGQGKGVNETAEKPVGYSYMGTWQDSSYKGDGQAPTISVEFEGTAIYLYCILASGFRSGGNIPWVANYGFSVDGEDLTNSPGGHFTNNLDSSTQYVNNVPVYVNTSLPYGKHVVKMTLLKTPNDPRNTLSLFDYAMYTVDESLQSSAAYPSSSIAEKLSSKTKPNVGAIAGGVVGGFVVIAAVALLFYIRLRRRHPSKNGPLELEGNFEDIVQPYPPALRSAGPTYKSQDEKLNYQMEALSSYSEQSRNNTEVRELQRQMEELQRQMRQIGDMPPEYIAHSQ